MNRSLSIRQIITRSPLCLLGLIGLTLFACPVAAQVFDSGPSLGSQFDEYVNVPNDPNIGDNASLGGSGSTIRLNIYDGGSVGDFFSAQSGCEVNILGDSELGTGSVGTGLQANSGCEVNVWGGSLGAGLEANSGSEVNIYRGSIDDELFRANSGSVINLMGRDFVLDGVPLFDLLTVNPRAVVGLDVFTIADRNVTLTGLLADGSPFSFDLNSDSTEDNFFAADATLTVSLVPRFGVFLGDVSNSGDFNFMDIGPFIEVLMLGSAANEYFLVEAADCNLDGEVNFLDISPFVGILTGS